MSLLTPYYHDPVAGITIYCGDCREILPLLPDKSVDLVLTDPPYGMNNDADYSRFSGGNTRRGPGTKHNSIVGDGAPFNPAQFLQWPCILWGANHYWNSLPKGGCLVWIKRNDGAFGTFLSDAELAFISGRSGVYCYRHVFAGSMKAIDAGFAPYEPSAHPNQKPVGLMACCLGFFAEARTVADPFMGSGTTLVAAKQLGRKAIGIEIEEKYCEIAVKRLSQEMLPFTDREQAPQPEQALMPL